MKLFIFSLVYLVFSSTFAQVKSSSLPVEVSKLRSRYIKQLSPTPFATFSDTELVTYITLSDQSATDINLALLEFQLRKDINNNHPSIRLLPTTGQSSLVIKAHRKRQELLVSHLLKPGTLDMRFISQYCNEPSDLKDSSDFEVAIKKICNNQLLSLKCHFMSFANNTFKNESIDNLSHMTFETTEHLVDKLISDNNKCDGIEVSISKEALKKKSLGRNPVALNHIINNDYFRLSVSLGHYTGVPLTPNWATFAQFGSRTVGRSMHLMEESLKILKTIDEIINLQQVSKFNDIPLHYKRLKEIANEPGMAMNGLKKFLRNIDTFSCNPFLIPAVCTFTRIGDAIIETRSEITTLYEAFKSGNRMIYKHMAPILNDFLNKNLYSENCKVNIEKMYSSKKWSELDPNGLIREALREYQRASDLAKLIKNFNEKENGNKQRLEKKRINAIKRANLLIVAQEQVLAQKEIYHHDLEAYQGMQTSLYDPIGEYQLVNGNWADFNTRMGISKEIMDFTGQQNIKASPELIDQLLSEKTDGTITGYFEERTQSHYKEKLFQKPVLPISPIK